jgi:two-component system alkaline phosphatase synthesis response regulator PhoP
MLYILDEDDSNRDLICYTLNSRGFDIEGFSKPSRFYEAIKMHIPDLILLDIMLPEERGFEILKDIRSSAFTKQVPVVLLSAKGDEYEKVKGFELGADDSVTKPVGMMELVARINAILRRIGTGVKQNILNVDGLYVDMLRHVVRAFGKDIVLSLKEYRLLCILLEREGYVFTREELHRSAWGYDFDGKTKTVDIHIRSLRNKLGEAGKYIQTIKGVGYKLEVLK